MIGKIKVLALALGLLIVGFFGWRTYHYFFDKGYPSLNLIGIEEGGHYAGDLHASLAGKDSYKVSDISMWLDGAPLLTKFKINSSSFEHPFFIPTKPLPNGKHTLKVEAINGTHAGNKTNIERIFYIDNAPLQAAFLRPDTEYKVFQGRTLHIQFQVNKDIREAHVETLSNSFPCFPEAKNSHIYECFIPINCEEKPNEYPLIVSITDRVGNSMHVDHKFQVILFPFKKQLLQVGSEKMKTEKELGLSDVALEQELEELLKKSPQEKLWSGSFYPPLEITGISTEYGTVRTTQEKGRYMHKAVDVLNSPKSVIWAPQNGIVVIKNRYVHSGNTVVIDHGYGIFSLFFHLDSFADINVGDKIKRGNPIGTLGKTGYASGYHLHWEMRINNVHVDPMQWIKPNF